MKFAAIAVVVAAGVSSVFAAGYEFPLRDVPRVTQSPGTSYLVADFDLDGSMDLLAVGVVSSASFAIQFGQGNGTFEPPSTQFHSVAFVADMNSDGLPDIVTRNGPEFFLHRNRGRRLFAEPVLLFNEPSSSVGAVADFNTDGHIDVLLTFSGPGRVRAVLLINDGKGALLTRSDDTNVFGFDVTAADLDHDGDTDLIRWHQSLDVFTNDGTGRFGFRRIKPSFTSVPVLADLDGDLRPELIELDPTSREVAVYSGSSSFLEKVMTLTTGLNPSTAFAADFNRDGMSDLAILGQQTETQAPIIEIHTSGEQGSLSRRSTINGRTGAPADFNGDGALDLIVDSAVIFGKGDGTFVYPSFVPVPGDGALREAVDFDSDGIDEIVVTAREGTYVGWLTTDGRYEYDLVLTKERPPFRLRPVAIGNVQGDAGKEVVVFYHAGLGSDPNCCWIGIASQTAPRQWVQTAFRIDAAVDEMLLADMTGDGISEIVMLTVESRTNQYGDEYRLRVHSADGSLLSSTYVAEDLGLASPHPLQLHALDADHDGAMDALVTLGLFSSCCHAPSLPGFVALFRGRADGSVGAPEFLMRGRIQGTRIHDANHDGIMDVFISSYDYGLQFVFLGGGRGLVQSSLDELRRVRIPDQVADFDLDGFDDSRFGSCIEYGSAGGTRERTCYLPSALGCSDYDHDLLYNCMPVRRGGRTPALMGTVRGSSNMVAIAPSLLPRPRQRDHHPQR